MNKVSLIGVAALAAIFSFTITSTVQAAADPAVKCEAGKLKEAGKYANCRMKADSKAVKKGELPDYSKCLSKFGDKWDKTEVKADGACPSNGDEVTVEAAITTCMGDVAAGLTKCGADGVEVDGVCWYLGTGLGQSCDSVCAGVGRVCDVGPTKDFAGSGGSIANCEIVATAMGLTLAAPGIDTPGSADGQGCVYNPGEFVVRIFAFETTCSATAGGSTYPRFCACN